VNSIGAGLGGAVYEQSLPVAGEGRGGFSGGSRGRILRPSIVGHELLQRRQNGKVSGDHAAGSFGRSFDHNPSYIFAACSALFAFARSP